MPDATRARRVRFLERVRANMLCHAQQLADIGNNFPGLPADHSGWNLPAFPMADAYREGLRARAAEIMAIYRDDDWLQRELARWERTDSSEEDIARAA